MIQMLQRLSSLILVAAAATPAVAQYRGMPAGWPTATYVATNTAGYAPAAGGQAYYVARPVYAAAPAGYQYAANQYAGNQYAANQYAPATVAYANPAYRAGYNTTLAAAPQARAAYRPVQYVAAAPQAGGTTAYYAPQAYNQQAYAQQAYSQQAYAGQAPAVAYYAPTTAQYAPGSAYSVTPAGGMSAGAEAYAGYGQSAPGELHAAAVCLPHGERPGARLCLATGHRLSARHRPGSHLPAAGSPRDAVPNAAASLVQPQLVQP
jgi:hypothetical protein